jgi:hypothetical protein
MRLVSLALYNSNSTFLEHRQGFPACDSLRLRKPFSGAEARRTHE